MEVEEKVRNLQADKIYFTSTQATMQTGSGRHPGIA